MHESNLPDNALLRDAFGLLLTPLHLEAVYHDGIVWIVDADEARGWDEAIPVSRFIADLPAAYLLQDEGQKLGTATLQGLVDELKAKDLELCLDKLKGEPATWLARVECRHPLLFARSRHRNRTRLHRAHLLRRWRQAVSGPARTTLGATDKPIKPACDGGRQQTFPPGRRPAAQRSTVRERSPG